VRAVLELATSRRAPTRPRRTGPATRDALHDHGMRSRVVRHRPSCARARPRATRRSARHPTPIPCASAGCSRRRSSANAPAADRPRGTGSRASPNSADRDARGDRHPSSHVREDDLYRANLEPGTVGVGTSRGRCPLTCRNPRGPIERAGGSARFHGFRCHVRVRHSGTPSRRGTAVRRTSRSRQASQSARGWSGRRPR